MKAEAALVGAVLGRCRPGAIVGAASVFGVGYLAYKTLLANENYWNVLNVNYLGPPMPTISAGF